MIIGHSQNQKWLDEMCKDSFLPNTLLFVGERGVGKKGVAFSFASWLLSGNGSFVDFASRYEYKENNNINQFYFSNIQIAQVRDLKTALSKTSLNGKIRTIIIDNVELWSYEVANSFLKLLEESNNNIIFILIATNRNRVIPTICSRSMIFNFYPTESSLIREKIDTKTIEDILIWWDKKPALAIELLSNLEKQNSVRSMIDDAKVFLDGKIDVSFKVIEKYKGDELKGFFYTLTIMIRSEEEYSKYYKMLKECDSIFRKIDSNINFLLVLRRLALRYT